ncbi:MAG: hypothetical protein ACD_44C00144G0005 [uncultured bacterium]|nr:MAG: hypothetical protein ACD_44C00144G0005 [uncultured bacterium]OGT15397.1 MAG: hypothetical protein A3B69_01860 [Gammaproteobacteria bacterium RIFCSPHIGHO2_02_FULL_38_33]OGT23583.1 MAG: hypothetical protein A2W47_03070 [Gammaproteobacteria bacterium RIFCSPHIGHO2_12_38_15]OGT69361.1 MAG: hypothetical protein A3I12_05650 [Gammaproteobacteria bacterium RIFCSPLOWO2_02_FULL_38_11]OGT77848.1 MAG: hypothetical protein A3G71_03660 [Gammaproteobacteria bacterium RIFCSPLOWO2_12_FULL_38_14]
MKTPEQSNPIFVYEVNLTIEIPIFNQHKTWLIEHFHDMVTKNNFMELKLFFVKNTDPTNDEYLRYQKIVAQYYISDYKILQDYLEKQSKKMRSQVIEKLGYHYSVSRRVFELAETFKSTSKSSL